MPVENVNTIKNLNEFYPASTDPVLEGDDHLRLIKSVLKNCFPNIDGKVDWSHTDINEATAYRKNITVFATTLLHGPGDAASWRATLGLGTMATRDQAEFAPYFHTHDVTHVTRAVPHWTGLVANEGVGVRRVGETAWGTSQTLEDTIEVGLRNSGVTAGTYGSATQVPRVTVDAYGRVTSVSNVNVASGGGSYTPPTALNAIGTYTIVSGSGAPAAKGSTFTATADQGIPAGSVWRVMGTFDTWVGTQQGGGVLETPVKTVHSLVLRIS